MPNHPFAIKSNRWMDGRASGMAVWNECNALSKINIARQNSNIYSNLSVCMRCVAVSLCSISLLVPPPLLLLLVQTVQTDRRRCKRSSHSFCRRDANHSSTPPLTNNIHKFSDFFNSDWVESVAQSVFLSIPLSVILVPQPNWNTHKQHTQAPYKHPI